MQRKRTVGTPEPWTGVLNLDGFEVVQQRHDGERNVWQLTVVPAVDAGVCPDCGDVSTSRHQTRERTGIHDLPIGDSRVELTVRTVQYECPPATTASRRPRPPWPRGRTPPSGSWSGVRP